MWRKPLRSLSMISSAYEVMAIVWGGFSAGVGKLYGEFRIYTIIVSNAYITLTDIFRRWITRQDIYNRQRVMEPDIPPSELEEKLGLRFVVWQVSKFAYTGIHKPYIEVI